MDRSSEFRLRWCLFYMSGTFFQQRIYLTRALTMWNSS